MTSDDRDRDAPWRRSPTGTATAERVSDRLDRPATDDGGDEELSPWSRAAAERVVEDRRPTWLVKAPRERRSRVIEPDPRHPVASVPETPPSAVTGELVLAAVGLLAVVIISALVGRALWQFDSVESVTEPVGPFVPERVDELWSLTIVERIESTVAGAGVVAFGTADELSIHELATGDLRWSQPFAFEMFDQQLHVLGDTVVVLGGAGSVSSVQSFDLESGEELWSENSVEDDFDVVEDRIARSRSLRDVIATTLVDPRTGDPIAGPYSSDGTDGVAPFIIDDDAGSITIYDPVSLEPIAGPFDAGDLQTIAPLGAGAVGFGTDNRIVAFDETGARTDERPFRSDAFGDFVGRAELVGGVPGGNIGIVSSGSSIGVVVEDGQLDVVWELNGRVGTPVLTDIGAVSVARVIGVTGEVDMALVDAVSGATITVTDSGITREAEPYVARNGYVLSPQAGAPRELAAFGFDNEQWWSLEVPIFATYRIADDGVLILAIDTRGSTLTVHGRPA